MSSEEEKPSPPANGRRSGRRRKETGTGGREAILDKLVELLRTQAANRLTMAEIAAYADVAPSLLKYYFGDRSGMLAAAAEHLISQTLAGTQQRAQAAADPVVELAVRISDMLTLETDYPHSHRLIMDEVINGDSVSAQAALELIAVRATRGYAGLLEEGAKRSELRKVDPLFLFFAVIGMTSFFAEGRPLLLQMRTDQPSTEQLKQEYAAFLQDLLLNGLKASSD